MNGQPNFVNRTLYHEDNLDFLRGMNSETVHLIATDPPFNKGRDFHATPDSLAAGAKFEKRVTPRMRDAAASARRFLQAPVIRIYTVEDYFNGRVPVMPRAA